LPLPLVAGKDLVLGFTVSIGGNKARLLDFAVDGLLEQLVEPRDLAGDLGEVREFGLDADRKLVRRKSGNPAVFIISSLYDESHGFEVIWVSGWFWENGRNTKKPDLAKRPGFRNRAAACCFDQRVG